MDLGAGIKPDKGARWAQALQPALMPGETIRLLVRASAGSMTDLVAVTDLRILAAQTPSHCAVKRELFLRDVADARESSGLRGKAVTVSPRDGAQWRLALSKGDDAALLVRAVAVSAATSSVELDSRSSKAVAEREETARQKEEVAAGIWPDTVVVGSRPRRKTAEIIIDHCRPGESPWLIIGSLGAGVLAAFDDRLMLVKAGAVTGFMAGSMGGARVSTFPFHDVTGIEYNAGLMNGVLEVLTPSYSGTANRDFWRGTGRSRNADSNDPYTLSNTLPLPKAEHAQALPQLNELRRRITEAKHQPPSRTVAEESAVGRAPVSVADELAKVASLRDAGILSDEEFQAAKSRILSD